MSDDDWKKQYGDLPVMHLAQNENGAWVFPPLASPAGVAPRQFAGQLIPLGQVDPPPSMELVRAHPDGSKTGAKIPLTGKVILGLVVLGGVKIAADAYVDGKRIEAREKARKGSEKPIKNLLAASTAKRTSRPAKTGSTKKSR